MRVGGVLTYPSLLAVGWDGTCTYRQEVVYFECLHQGLHLHGLELGWLSAKKDIVIDL